LIPNAIDTGKFAPGPPADLKQFAGIPPAPADTVRVGLVATYARWKGHRVVLDAARRLMTTAPDLPVRWYLIGGPIYYTGGQFSELELQEEFI
jgi:glycosyltransferase involved in cell wall biosynthesis